MAYTLNTPWQYQTWGAIGFTKYARLAARPITGGSIDGSINPFLTDIARGISLIVNGTTVTEAMTPDQDTLAAADYYFLGGHEYTISDEQATVLINAGYGDYVTPV